MPSPGPHLSSLFHINNPHCTTMSAPAGSPDVHWTVDTSVAVRLHVDYRPSADDHHHSRSKPGLPHDTDHDEQSSLPDGAGLLAGAVRSDDAHTVWRAAWRDDGDRHAHVLSGDYDLHPGTDEHVHREPYQNTQHAAAAA